MRLNLRESNGKRIDTQCPITVHVTGIEISPYLTVNSVFTFTVERLI